MQTVLTNDGDSTAAVIPEALLEKAGVKLGDRLELVVEGDRIIVTKADDSSED